MSMNKRGKDALVGKSATNANFYGLLECDSPLEKQDKMSICSRQDHFIGSRADSLLRRC